MSGADPEIGRARAQREQSIACAALSLAVAAALFASNFGPEAQSELARSAVRAHRVELEQLQQLLARNGAELSQDRAALASLRAAAHP